MTHPELWRAAIGIITESGSIRAIITEYEGNPAFTGALLAGKYQQPKKLKELLELGNLAILAEEVHPAPEKTHLIIYRSAKNESNLLQERVTVALYRDIRIVKTGKGYCALEKEEAQEYSSVDDIRYKTGIMNAYIYNEKQRRYATYAYETATNSMKGIYVDYEHYATNLEYFGDISHRTAQEKINLKRKYSREENQKCA